MIAVATECGRDRLCTGGAVIVVAGVDPILLIAAAGDAVDFVVGGMVCTYLNSIL